MIRQLAHLNFISNDLSKIIDFYVNKLGMQVKFTLNNQEGVPFGYYFDCGNSTFLSAPIKTAPGPSNGSSWKSKI